MLLLGLCLLVTPALALELAVTDDGRTAGYLTLGWDADGDVELQQRGAGGDWVTIYRGPDAATTLSGLANGEITWRARTVSNNGATTGAWGPTLSIQVAHHAMGRALAVFITGAVMFLVLLACIVMPWREKESSA
ncbi:hypothetical protein F3N42_02635 [Marinihelvus fidelis]|uniref:DOMON domain-containing protein n=1 Tax=Marinihelvus fidelis TaxID=2613842 RepID=A0A5N0TFF4_9GAMM|nr:hypothetical protein [Marinihelvus fidelis]KAA9133268.1 hypothetical protein F3N42_02635 [Marinihelvus fidelis]